MQRFLQFASFAGVILLGAHAFAQSDPETNPQTNQSVLYVADRFEVPLRSTGCNTCAIVHAGLASGTMVIDLGREESGWRHIRTQGGTEGWMESRFLFSEPAARDQLSEIQDRTYQAELQLAALLTALEELGVGVQMEWYTDADGQNLVAANLDEVGGIGSQYEELVRRNQMLQQEVDLLVARNERLADTAWKSWFFYGAAAVGGGMILALVLPLGKRRRKFSEWG